MDPVLQKYYEDRFEMFQSQGWKDLIEDLIRIKSEVNKVENCVNLDTAKGQLHEINYILNLENMTNEAYKGIIEDADV